MRIVCTMYVLLLGLSPTVVPAADFAGQVVDNSGAPVAGATVWLTTEDWVETYEPSALAEAQTDGQGCFEFANAPAAAADPGWYNICAHRQGSALAWTDRLGQSHPSLLLVLEREFPIRGHVADSEGNPVAGIRPAVTFLVRYPGFDPFQIGDDSAALAPPAALSDLLVAPTDEQGEFELRHLPPGIDLHISIDDPRYARADGRFEWGELASGDPIAMTLEPPGTIRGRVYRAEDGTPVAGVSVTTSPSGATTTDDQGRYELTKLPPAVYQVYLNELPVEFTAKAVEVTVESGATVEGVDLQVIPGVELTGMVTEQGTGQPLGRAGVCANTAQQPKAGISFPVMHTGADGRYSLRAPEGPAQLRPFDMPEGWRSAESFGGGMRRLTVSANQPPAEVNFEVVRTRSLQGTVLGPDGQPAAGAQVVMVSDGEASFPRERVADAEGRFTIPNAKPDARYWLRAHLGDSMTLEDRVVEAGDRREIVLRLSPNARPKVTGRAMGTDGKPVAFALVRVSCGVQGTAGPVWRTLMCHGLADETGCFALRNLWPEMPYGLRVRAGGYSEESTEVEPLDPGEIRDIGDISLAVADLVVAGFVVDDEDEPVPNVVVEAQPRGGHFSRSKMVRTDLEGRFRLEDLPRQDMVLTVDTWQCASVPTPIGPGMPEGADIVIKAIPREKQFLARHEFIPPLEGNMGDATATLRWLYRYKAFDRDGTVGQYLGLDFDGPRDPETRMALSAWVFDGQRKLLGRAPAAALVGEKHIWGYEWPESDTLARVLIGYLPSPTADRPLELGPLQLQLPLEHQGRVFLLSSLELTDEWPAPSVPGDPATPGDPPYLLAKVYTIVSERDRYFPATARAMPEGPELVPIHELYYSPEQGALELPPELAEMEEALREEVEQALMALVDWGAQAPDPAVVAGYWFQSAGGHGTIALPEGVTIDLTPIGAPAVAFDNIPLPEEFTAVEF